MRDTLSSRGCGRRRWPTLLPGRWRRKSGYGLRESDGDSRTEAAWGPPCVLRVVRALLKERLPLSNGLCSLQGLTKAATSTEVSWSERPLRGAERTLARCSLALAASMRLWCSDTAAGVEHRVEERRRFGVAGYDRRTCAGVPTSNATLRSLGSARRKTTCAPASMAGRDGVGDRQQADFDPGDKDDGPFKTLRVVYGCLDKRLGGEFS